MTSGDDDDASESVRFGKSARNRVASASPTNANARTRIHVVMAINTATVAREGIVDALPVHAAPQRMHDAVVGQRSAPTSVVVVAVVLCEDDDDDNPNASTPSARPIPWYMTSSIVRRPTAMAMSVADARTSPPVFPKRSAHDLSEAFRHKANAVDAKEDEATAYGTARTSPRMPRTWVTAASAAAVPRRIGEWGFGV